MAAAGAVLGIVGGGVSAYGQLQQGAAAQAAGNYNANIASENAAQLSAEEPIAVEQVRRRAEMIEGAAKAQYGASGVQGGVGSPLQVMQQNNAQAALDESLKEHEYDMKIYGYQTTAALDIFEGSAAQTSAQWAAGGSLLGAGGGAVKNSNIGDNGGGGGNSSSSGGSSLALNDVNSNQEFS